MSMIRWLHISDLHLNTPGFSSSFSRDELPKFLKRSNISCEYVFCTGDLRDAKSGVFPSDNGQFLKDICKAVGNPELFIVPGNHDINRGEINGERDATVHRLLDSYSSEVGIIEPIDLEVLHKGKAEFHTYISNVLPADRISKYSQPHFNVETKYFNILHVDSTLSYTIGHEDNMILGTNHLYDAIKTINKDKPTILLTHYAYTMLAQQEQRIVRELLYRNGIQLWLAGHEHEHNLQPVSYLHSIQAGELRIEDKCNTSVLVGEFDTKTLSGQIKAYAWFNEGWYLYPAVWHGIGRDDEYPFTLRIQEGEELRSLEAINSTKHNQQYQRPFSLLDSLFADIENRGTEYRGRNGLVECLADAWNRNENLVLLADGGMGKTTRMLMTCDQLSGNVAVFIPLEGTEPESLVRDICRALFSDSSEERLYQYAKDRHGKPDVYLFLDGMNEVCAEKEKDFVAVIKRIARDYPGVQIVVSSRSDFTERYKLDRFSIGHLKPLRNEQIRELFTDTELNSIEKNPPLNKLVQNPLMATLYKNISPEIGKEKDYIDWIEIITNETELLYDYYSTQILLSLKKDIKVVQYILQCLPYIAFCFEHTARHTMPLEEFRNVLKNAAVLKPDEKLDAIRRGMRVKTLSPISDFDLEDYLFHVSHLLYEINGFVSFPHQIHRDYLSAVWLTKTQELFNCWNERLFTTTISNHICALSRNDYWHGIAETIMGLARNRDNCRNLIVNAINTFPYNKASGTPDFSHLDLRGIRLPDYSYAGDKIKLNGAKIDNFCIGCEAEESLLFSRLSFSSDNEYLVGIAGGELVIYSMETGLKVYRSEIYTDGRQVVKAFIKFSSDNRFLFIKRRSDYIVFEKNDITWRRNGEISETNNKEIRRVVLHDGVLTFYYKNQFKSYSLADTSLIKNEKMVIPYENCDGTEDITKIELSASPEREDELSVAISADDQYRAVCYQDGRLVVYYRGGKVLHSLESGKSVLKTAAISKDGNRAVTLSANTYQKKRRIQLWDLDNRLKVNERFCDAFIEAIYLTDHGEWIIGTGNGYSWFWNWDAPEKAFRRPERFISETEHGMTTYGNCLLYQDGNGGLRELNLDTKKERILGKYPSIQYATFLSDGSIAFVGSLKKCVEFNSIRSKNKLKINREHAKVINIHGFKTQPFIAVQTVGGLVSMYHIETGQRTRKLRSSVGYRIVAFHPDQNVFSFSDGNKRLETFRYFEWVAGSQKHGKWCEPQHPAYDVEGRIIAIGFNTVRKEQIIVESNGKITYMQDRFCDFHSQTKVITSFSVNSYDFSGVICENDIKDQLRKNGVRI